MGCLYPIDLCGFWWSWVTLTGRRTGQFFSGKSSWYSYRTVWRTNSARKHVGKGIFSAGQPRPPIFCLRYSLFIPTQFGLEWPKFFMITWGGVFGGLFFCFNLDSQLAVVGQQAVGGKLCIGNLFCPRLPWKRVVSVSKYTVSTKKVTP